MPAVFVERLKAAVRESPLLERLARRLLDRRYQLARRFLRGVGIEIGALDRPLMLPHGAKAFYLDRLLPRELRAHYPELVHRKIHVSVIGDGENLACIADGALDFIVANHVIEHCEDPIAALSTFARKLKAGGTLFMAVPDMRLTFDRHRAPTSWEHVWTDHEQGPQSSRREHYQEWAEVVEGRVNADANRRAEELRLMGYRIHFHCWTAATFAEFLRRLRQSVPLDVAAVRSWRNENIFVLTKHSLGGL